MARGKCPKCEKLGDEGDKFCRKCGLKLEPPPKRHCGHRFHGVICPKCKRLSFPQQ